MRTRRARLHLLPPTNHSPQDDDKETTESQWKAIVPDYSGGDPPGQPPKLVADWLCEVSNDTLVPSAYLLKGKRCKNDVVKNLIEALDVEIEGLKKQSKVSGIGDAQKARLLSRATQLSKVLESLEPNWFVRVWRRVAS